MDSKANIGARRLVVGAHYGLAGWMAQRATALVMAAYTVILLVSFLVAHDFSYSGWSGVFAAPWMKVATFIALLSLFYHVWVGMRDIWMDYIQATGVKLVLQLLTILWLIGCAGYAVQTLWSV
jgi:succinate dehydrogenase / fumarate reductase membrane anchor subunit